MALQGNYPTSLDTKTTYAGTDKVSIIDHANVLTKMEDAIVDLESKVGVDSSAVTSTHDYKLSSVADGEKAVSTSGNQTITGDKTFSGTTTTNGITNTTGDISGNIKTSVIKDTNGNESINVTATASAVNQIDVINSATGNAPEIKASGDDTNINLKLTAKGTGKVDISGIKYPTTDGTASQFMQTDGAGNLSFASITQSSFASTMPVKDYPTVDTSYANVKTNTIANLHRFIVSSTITVSKISYFTNTTSGSTTDKIAIYNESGSTRLISETTGTRTASALQTHTLSTPVELQQGIYYFAIVPTTTITTGYINAVQMDSNLDFTPSGSGKSCGTLTVTAGTLPTTIDPTALSFDSISGIMFRIN